MFAATPDNSPSDNSGEGELEGGSGTHLAGMSAGDLWDVLNDPYLPFRLYADHQQGISLSSIAVRTGLPLAWVRERVEAARVCIESGSRLRPPFADGNRSPQL